MKKTNSLVKRFISYYKPYKLEFFFDMLASLVMAGISMLYPILTRKIYSEFVKDENINLIIICGAALIGVYIVRMILRFLVDYIGHGIGVKMQADMRRDIFSKLEDLPFSYFDENDTGSIMSRVTNDLMQVSELAHHGPENVIICSITLVGALIYLITINWILALIIFACAPILFTISLLTRQKQLKAFTETRKDIAVINGNIQSSISGIRVTKSFNNKDKEMEIFEKGNKKFVKSRMYAYKTMGIYHSSTNFVIDLFNVACIVGGGILTITTDVFGIEDYLAFAVSVSLFTAPLNTLVGFVEQFQDGASGFKRFVEIIDVEPEHEYEGAKDNVLLEGDIEFKHVAFKYETSEDILTDVNFKIKKGETIALVGESGGGKTTICHLLPGFYRKESGDILFDGIKIEDISLKALRENIGIVQQDVFLFNATIRSNILYGKLNASMDEVIEAAKKAKIYDFIMSLPDGFETRVGERGVKLSGGQKQRISIARIFLRNPSILILDEATSALDNTNELLIQESLNDLAKGRTTVVVAHRLSTIKNADRIFVVNRGQIVESGNHEDLIKLNGEYANLYNQQFRVISIKD